MEGWGGRQFRSLGDWVVSLCHLPCYEFPRANTPLTDLSTKNIFQGQMKMTFGLSTQFAYLCHLSPLLAWTTEIYTLSGGMFTDESVLELARGGGKDSEPRAQDEVLVLVLSLNLSGEPGKSLHLLPRPHLGGTNTSKLNSLSQDCRYCL